MIRKLSIRNYGSNRRLDIDLSPHVTCITGESYRGKSWVMRAFKWLALNHPSGIRFIRWGSKLSVVQVEAENHTIIRKRGKALNTYTADERKLEAFGNDVPNKVRRVLNLSKLNFQIQQEMPHGDGPLFWFALTPGQVSKRLNRIVNLDVIDRTLGNLQSGVHKAKSVLDVCQERLQEAKEQKKALSFVKEMAEEWDEVVDFRKQAAALFMAADTLERLLNDIIKQQLILKATKHNLGEAERELEGLEILRDKIIGIDREHQELSSLLTEIEMLRRQRAEARTELYQLEREYEKALGNRCPLCHNKILKREPR